MNPGAITKVLILLYQHLMFLIVPPVMRPRQVVCAIGPLRRMVEAFRCELDFETGISEEPVEDHKEDFWVKSFEVGLAARMFSTFSIVDM